MSQRSRKNSRLQDYDYSQSGWYFVTICLKNREELFGQIINNEMVLNESGLFVKKCWLEIPQHFQNAQLDEFIVMPNHVHGILIIENGDCDVGNKNICSLPTVPWQTKWSGSLSSIIRGFKIGVTKYFRENQGHCFAWQKSFYDNIIRDENSLNQIREYILNNPMKWELDRNNEENIYY